MIHTGRHFLQIPGPTNVPDRVLREIAQATIDHRGPEFADLGIEVLERLRGVFRTRGPVVVFPSSGTGAAEAALANTLSPGDRILIFETGWFSHIAWRQVAERLGLIVEYVPGTWRRGASPETLEQRLKDDGAHELKAVVVVHNETSTGVVSRIADLRRAMNRSGHPALLIVDAISSLASIDLRHDDWEIDVTVCGSQKGLMVPPGLGFNAVSEKALAAHAKARLPEVVLGLAGDAEGEQVGVLSRTRPRRIFSTACAKRCGCSTKKASRMSSSATRDTAPPHAQPSVRGDSTSSQKTRRSIRVRSRRCTRRMATTPIDCGRSSSSSSTCRSEPVSESSPARCSESDTWARSTT